MIQSKINVPFPNSYWVLPGQFLAGEHPVEISADATTSRLMALLDAGIQTFVNLTEERELLPGYALLLRSLAGNRGIDIELLQIPIPDRRVPTAETVRSTLDIIDRSIANERPVFVHCFAGVGRTGTIVGCHLRRHSRAAQQDVIAKISELRSQMPGGSEPSPHTLDQIQAVESWEVGS